MVLMRELVGHAIPNMIGGGLEMLSRMRMRLGGKSPVLDSVRHNHGMTKNFKSGFAAMKRFYLLFGVFFISACKVYSYDSVDQGFEWRTKNSDAVVVGEVVSVTDGGCAYESRCAEIRPLSVLKGEGSQRMLVLFEGPVSILNPVCCVEGATYLFYLRKIERSSGPQYFESVDGVFSVYRLDDMFKDG